MIDYKHAQMIDQFSECYKKLSPHICMEIEAPYNYYGERGVVDLVTLGYALTPDPAWATNETTLREYPHIQLFEFKTKLENLGETIRQVKKAQKYFILSNDTISGQLIKAKNLARVSSYLLFADTIENIEALTKYRNIFSNIDNCYTGLLIDASRSDFYYNKVLPFYSLGIMKADRGWDFIKGKDGFIGMIPHGTGKGVELWNAMEEKAFFDKIEWLNKTPISSFGGKT